MTYILETGGRLFVIENVPARVSQRTGEQLFSPETVERPQPGERTMRKTVLWAIAWTLLAFGNAASLLRPGGDEWFSGFMSAAGCYLAVTFWMEARALRRLTRRSSTDKPAA